VSIKLTFFFMAVLVLIPDSGLAYGFTFRNVHTGCFRPRCYLV